MTTHSPNQLMDTIKLAAVVTAVACAREFVGQTLKLWHLSALSEKATLLVSELVTNAVRSTGSTDPEPDLAVLAGVPYVQVQVNSVGRAVRVEVWDASQQLPVVQRQDPDAEGGRGLFLVQALSDRWGSYLPATGGKVVWFDLIATTTEVDSAYFVAVEPLPQRVSQKHLSVAAAPYRTPVDIAMLERVIWGLQRLRRTT